MIEMIEIASMGPGSFDPGNSPCPDEPLSTTKLQWGRGLSTPEIAAAGRLRWRQGRASMGPGSFDPGNASRQHPRQPHRLASMGPGSFDPGNKHIDQASPVAGEGFNGAGVFRPRKCPSCRL